MRKVIGVVACGLTVAACSASIPDFLKPSPSKAALRFESKPAGAEVKVSGQSCRTPCELTLEGGELSATFAHKGYQPQTVPVQFEAGGLFSAARFAPNPVYADLLPVVASAKKRQMPVASATHPGEPNKREATAAPNAPEAAEVPVSGGWSPGDVK